jgi:hypothetical protein
VMAVPHLVQKRAFSSILEPQFEQNMNKPFLMWIASISRRYKYLIKCSI